MKLTATKVIRELHKNHGWNQKNLDEYKWITNALITDVLKVVDDHLRKQKGLTIK